MIPAKRFYMIRHGETEANVAQMMAGSLDSPLTANGRDQAKKARDIVANLAEKPAFIVHSQLSRARDTAHIINEKLGLPMTEDPDIAELHSGDWEGMPYDQCRTMFDDWTDPPGGETFEQFFGRIRNAKKRILGSGTALPLIVSHGGVFRAIAKMYGRDVPGVQNCHLHEFLPAPAPDSIFPWDIWCYDHDGQTTRSRSKIFHAD